MGYRTLARLGAVLWMCVHSPVLRAQMYPPITSLARGSDLIVVASVGQIISPGGTADMPVTLQLAVSQVLKGTLTSGTLVASIASATGPVSAGPTITFPPRFAGVPAIWFLKLGTNGYQVLPRRKRGYLPEELFWPLTGVDTLPPGATIEDQLLAYAVKWYMSLDHSQNLDDAWFLSSFEPWDSTSPTPPQVIAAVQPLIASSSTREQIVGLTAALRVGSADALTVLTANLAKLQSDPEFPALTSAIALYPKHKDQTWLVPLQNLVNLKTGAPGLDAAVAGALAAIKSKAVLPIMVQLLDSGDPAAQMAAARYFGVFSLLANSKGELLDSAPRGPFATPDTQTFTPRPESNLTVSQYASFWKNWWNQNRATLGFPAQ